MKESPLNPNILSLMKDITAIVLTIVSISVAVSSCMKASSSTEASVNINDSYHAALILLQNCLETRCSQGE